jgi:hypothetical protein
MLERILPSIPVGYLDDNGNYWTYADAHSTQTEEYVAENFRPLFSEDSLPVLEPIPYFLATKKVNNYTTEEAIVFFDDQKKYKKKGYSLAQLHLIT